MPPDQGRLDRLTNEPLEARHAGEMVEVLAAPELYQDIGGAQPMLADLSDADAVGCVGQNRGVLAASSASFTLLGAGIAASATLAAVVVKALLDSRADAARHRRELDRLAAELSAQRRQRRGDLVRECFVALLTSSLGVYDQARTARRERRLGALDDAGYVARLKNIDSRDGQRALEEIRLVAEEGAVTAASAHWQLLRGSDVMVGRALGATDWAGFKESYWASRQALIAACRAELDLDLGIGSELAGS